MMCKNPLGKKESDVERSSPKHFLKVYTPSENLQKQ